LFIPEDSRERAIKGELKSQSRAVERNNLPRLEKENACIVFRKK
jgi:hypothetical protein